jgi:aspartate/methionine/tyrosine aminotransferase
MLTSDAVFSHRVAWDRAENPLAVLERARRQDGAAIIDLTVSNPTSVGLTYPTALLREALAHPDVGVYEAAPRGLESARAAVAADYASKGIALAADDLLLTASSSESYGLLFKLLCDPGDSVLVPQPSYPLFDYLTTLEGVRTIPYLLSYDGAWHVDFASVTEALAQAQAVGRPRALIAVSPNNPTGSFTKQGELRRLAGLCASHDLALISDEVFADYGFSPGGSASVGVGAGAAGGAARANLESDAQFVRCAAASPIASDVLTFSLGGLSKSCGLPQLKLGWVAARGPADQLRAAWERLELIADTTLSVGTPVQLAAARLLTLGGRIREQIQARVHTNRETLRSLLPGFPSLTLLAAEGGWSLILRLPAVESDETWAKILLAEDGLLVHPGYLFDMPRGTFLTISLLPQPELFARAAERLLRRCAGARESS